MGRVNSLDSASSIKTKARIGGWLTNYTGGAQHICHCRFTKLKLKSSRALPVGCRGGGTAEDLCIKDSDDRKCCQS